MPVAGKADINGLGEKDPNRSIEEKKSYRWIEGYRRVYEQQTLMLDTQLIY